MDSNSPKYPVLDELPEIDFSDFPALPSIESLDGVLVVEGTEWDNPESELFAAAFITCCIEAGSWCAVDYQTIKALFSRYPLIFTTPLQIVYAGLLLTSNGYLEIVIVEGQDYFIPKLHFVKIALGVN